MRSIQLTSREYIIFLCPSKSCHDYIIVSLAVVFDLNSQGRMIKLQIYFQNFKFLVPENMMNKIFSPCSLVRDV